jgi:hypothetical protein
VCPVRLRSLLGANRLIGTTVTVLVDERDKLLRVVEPVTGEVHAEHALVAPRESASSTSNTLIGASGDYLGGGPSSGDASAAGSSHGECWP